LMAAKSASCAGPLAIPSSHKRAISSGV
jgi:hypothetical protein